ncbi:hypothetical protein [Microlunatus flavus]|nr:hypothetical protein [Microlunatus flavus]
MSRHRQRRLSTPSGEGLGTSSAATTLDVCVDLLADALGQLP